MARQRSHYDTLGVDREVETEELRRAWKMLVQVWHPDRFDGEMREHAERQTASINEAYSVLRDADSRSTYDARLDYDAGAATPPAHSRPSSTQTAGTPGVTHQQRLATPAADITARSALIEFAQAFEEAARRYPRVVGSLAACLVLLFGGGLLYAHAGGSHVPPARLSALRSAAPTSNVSARAAAEADAMLKDLAVDGGGSDAADTATSDNTAASPPQSPAAPQSSSAPATAPQSAPTPNVAAQDPSWDSTYDEVPPQPRRIIRVMPKRMHR